MLEPWCLSSFFFLEGMVEGDKGAWWDCREENNPRRTKVVGGCWLLVLSLNLCTQNIVCFTILLWDDGAKWFFFNTLHVSLLLEGTIFFCYFWFSLT